MGVSGQVASAYTKHDWVIIAGGPHGACAARALSAQGASLRIVEPSGQLLHRWHARSSAVEMTWMRSPVGHHLDAIPNSLRHYLHLQENRDVAGLAGDYLRPTHRAFLRHSAEVIDRCGLDELVVEGRVDSIQREEDHLVVRGDGVDLSARRVLLAIGANEQRWPSWARRLHADGAPIRHLFDEAGPRYRDVLGGGISAVQRALSVRRSTQQPVRLWMRRPLQVQEFDTDRDWTRHRFESKWSAMEDVERLEFLQRHPVRGSVPRALAKVLAQAVERGSVRIVHGLTEARWMEGKLLLQGEGETLESSGLTLATGMKLDALPDWLLSTVERLQLPMLGGCPRLAEDMHWGAGIYATGPLARLRLGPMAPNLAGARWATSKLPGVKMQPM